MAVQRESCVQTKLQVPGTRPCRWRAACVMRAAEVQGRREDGWGREIRGGLAAAPASHHEAMTAHLFQDVEGRSSVEGDAGLQQAGGQAVCCRHLHHGTQPAVSTHVLLSSCRMPAAGRGQAVHCCHLHHGTRIGISVCDWLRSCHVPVCSRPRAWQGRALLPPARGGQQLGPAALDCCMAQHPGIRRGKSRASCELKAALCTPGSAPPAPAASDRRTTRRPSWHQTPTPGRSARGPEAPAGPVGSAPLVATPAVGSAMSTNLHNSKQHRRARRASRDQRLQGQLLQMAVLDQWRCTTGNAADAPAGQQCPFHSRAHQIQLGSGAGTRLA